MQRATNVRPLPKKSPKKKNPPAVAEGLQCVRDQRAKPPRRGIRGAFRAVLQARDLVAALMRIDATIAAGERVEARAGEGLKSFYRACWRVYEACGDQRERVAFEAITGETWARFEAALDALGWRLLPPDRRKAVAKIGGMVEAGDVFGDNEYAQ